METRALTAEQGYAAMTPQTNKQANKQLMWLCHHCQNHRQSRATTIPDGARYASNSPVYSFAPALQNTGASDTPATRAAAGGADGRVAALGAS